MFSVVIPGFTPAISQFQPIGIDSVTGQAQRFGLSIPLPANFVVQSLCIFFALPPQQSLHQILPPTHGCSIYLSDNAQNWEYMGCLTHAKPSILINPPLTYDSSSQNQNFSMLGQQQQIQQQQQQHMLHIGIALEPIETLQNLEQGHMRAEQNQSNQVASLVQYLARNLFNFMTSFTRTLDNREMIVLPTNALDTWMRKMNTKLQNDPYFWKRSSE